MELKIKNINTTTSSDGSQYGKFVIELKFENTYSLQD